MLTMDEITGSQEAQLEQYLADLDEAELRAVIDDGCALARLRPPHLSSQELQHIAERTLNDLLVRKVSQSGPGNEQTVAASPLSGLLAPFRSIFTSS